MPFDQVQHLQKKATINVIIEAKSEISPFLPGKFAHCVAANKPILLIGPHYSESKRLLGDDYALTFDFDEVSAMETAISRLYKDWKAGNPLSLQRPDLLEYLSIDYLKAQIMLPIEFVAS